MKNLCTLAAAAVLIFTLSAPSSAALTGPVITAVDADMVALPLTSGMSYTFGVQLAAATPSVTFTSDGSRCQVRAVIAKE